MAKKPVPVVKEPEPVVDPLKPVVQFVFTTEVIADWLRNGWKRRKNVFESVLIDGRIPRNQTNFVFDLAKKSVLPGGGVVWFRKSRKFNTDGMYPVEDHKDYRGWGKKG